MFANRLMTWSVMPCDGLVIRCQEGWEVLGEVSADHGASERADDPAALLAESCRLAAQVGVREMVSAGDPVASVRAVLAGYAAPGFLVKRTGGPDERARFGGCGAGLHPAVLCAKEG
jgi:hypothetical protein